MVLCKCGTASEFMFVRNSQAWCFDCLVKEIKRLKTFELWYYGDNHSHVVESFQHDCGKDGFHVRAQNGETWCFGCLSTEIARLTVFELAYFNHTDRLNTKKRVSNPPTEGNGGELTFEDKMILIFLNRSDILVGQSADSNEIVVHHKLWWFEGRSHNVISAAKAAMLDEQAKHKRGVK